MGIYNFKKRFVPFILSGEKQHTIRARRAHPDKPGNTLHLYTGLRQKGTKLLMRVPCVKVEEIVVYDVGGVLFIQVDGAELSRDECDALAKRDGFPGGWKEMSEFWKETHAGEFPFSGHIIHWRKKI